MKSFAKILMLFVAVTAAQPSIATSAPAAQPKDRLSDVFREKTATAIETRTPESRERLLKDVAAFAATLTPQQRLQLVTELTESLDQRLADMNKSKVGLVIGLAALEVVLVLVTLAGIKTKDPFLAEAVLYIGATAVALPLLIGYGYFDEKKTRAYVATLLEEMTALKAELSQVKVSLESQIAAEAI